MVFIQQLTDRRGNRATEFTLFQAKAMILSAWKTEDPPFGAITTAKDENQHVMFI